MEEEGVRERRGLGMGERKSEERREYEIGESKRGEEIRDRKLREREDEEERRHSSLKAVKSETAEQ